MVTSYSKLLLIIALHLNLLNSAEDSSFQELERHAFICNTYLCGLTCLAIGKPFCGVGTCCLVTGCYACVAPVIGEKVANIIDKQPGRVNSLRR